MIVSFCACVCRCVCCACVLVSSCQPRCGEWSINVLCCVSIIRTCTSHRHLSRRSRSHHLQQQHHHSARARPPPSDHPIDDQDHAEISAQAFRRVTNSTSQRSAHFSGHQLLYTFSEDGLRRHVARSLPSAQERRHQHRYHAESVGKQYPRVSTLPAPAPSGWWQCSCATAHALSSGHSAFIQTTLVLVSR